MTYDATTFRVVLAATHTSSGSQNEPLVKKLRAFAKLPSGWSYGRGTRIADEVISRAEQILEFGTQIHLKAEVFPGTDGDILVAFHQDEKCVQVTVNRDLTLGLRIEQGHGPQFDDVIEPLQRVDNESQVYLSIIGLVKDDHAWKSHASSTSSTLVEYSDASSIPRSKTRAA